MQSTIQSITDEIRSKDPETMKKYKEIYSKHFRQFSIRTGKDANKSNFYFVIQVPSIDTSKDKSKKRALSYDVVIQVLNSKKSSTNIFDKPIRFFSNSPSFTFTYAYVFNKNHLLIPWLKGKYSATVLGNRPKVRNPDEKIELDQSLKIALLYITETYKYKNMEQNTFSTNRVFKGIINQKLIYNSITTAIEKTDENKKVADTEKAKAARKARVFSTLKNPIQAGKETISEKRKTANSNQGRTISTSKRTNSSKSSTSKITPKKKKGAMRSTKR